jgi:hypothetical protein
MTRSSGAAIEVDRPLNHPWNGFGDVGLRYFVGLRLSSLDQCRPISPKSVATGDSVNEFNLAQTAWGFVF